jgi:IS605 OrfB family transposase
MIMRKMRIRLGVEPRQGETPQECKRRQDSTLREWAGAYRFTYNQAVLSTRVDPLNPAQKPMPFCKDLLRQRFSAQSVRDPEKWAEAREELGFEVGELINSHIDHRLVDSDSDPRWLLRTPADIRNSATRDVIKAEMSNREKKKIEIGRRAQHIAEGRPLDKCQKVHSWSLKLKRRCNPSAWTTELTNQCIRNVSVQPRPERRKYHEDGRYANQEKRALWTRFELCPKDYDLGPLWLTEEVQGGVIATDCRLTLDMCGNWHLCVPVSVDPPPSTVKPEATRRVVALDPGECIFQMGYCVEHTVAYGNKAEDCGNGRALETARQQSVAARDASKASGTASTTHANRARRVKGRLRWFPGNGGADRLFALCQKTDEIVRSRKRRPTSPREQYNLKNQANRLRRKVRNLVDDAHRKIALDLVRNYDTILIPRFNVKEMVMREREDGRRRILRSKTARSILNWSHFRFREFLLHKALRYGKEVVVCTERYTSKGCAVCGRINTVGGKRWYKCAFCGHQGHRDGCAARNILLQYVTS